MNKNFSHRIRPYLMILLGLLISQAEAGAHVRFCIFDMAGVQGDTYSLIKDQALVMQQWGVVPELKAYTEERIAAEDFKAGQCDGVIITTLRGRQFNPFVGSIDSVGAVPTAKHLRVLVQLLANPKMASRMVHGQYEAIGIVPLGGAYVMVRDRTINSVEKIAGKKIAVMDWDKSQAKMVQQLGAQPVSSDITNFAGKFNNGQVDIIAAPVVAYRPLELYKGIGSTGAIFRFPLAQVTESLYIRRDKFPADFGQKSREYIAGQFDKTYTLIDRAEKEIPVNQWLDLAVADKEKYIKLLRESRIELAKDGTYDKDMMHLLKGLRCKLDASNPECAMTDE